MDKSNQEKIFKLMCSDCWQVGVELFKANELDFDEFVDYALHRARWVECNYDYGFKYEMILLNRSFRVYYRKGIKQLDCFGLARGEIEDGYIDWKLSTILQTNPNFEYPSELDNEIYEDYMANKIYNEFKTNLKIEFDKLI